MNMNSRQNFDWKLFTATNSLRDSIQYQNFEAEDDEAAVVEGLQFAEHIFPEKMFMLCPVSHPTIRYVSNSCQVVLGYPANEIKSKTIKEFTDLIHPDDIEGFWRCLHFVEKNEPLDPMLHRILINYRIKNKHGHYIQVCDEKLGLKTQSGKYIYMAIIHDVSTENKTNNVKLEILKQQKGKYVKFSTYNPQLQQSDITPRQEDVIRLIKKGFTNKEIANSLHVSIYTVKNHKQALFKKINVSSSLELASIALTV